MAKQTRGRRMVCRLGAPQVRQHSRFRRLRRQGLYLEGARRRFQWSPELALATHLRLPSSQGISQHRLVVTARGRLPPRMCLLRWQR